MTAEATLRRAASAVLAATVAVAAVTAIGTASAGTASGASCPSTPKHPFRPWLDPMAYTLAPDGGFEAQARGWQLSGGAKVVAGNEPFKVGGSTDARSLSLPVGGSALSPEFCAGLGEPTARLFAVGGNSTSKLRVEVLYRTALGPGSQTVAVVPGMRTWGPTLQVPLLGNLVGLTSLDGLTTRVRLRFTPVGSTGWRVDDVYVDPWKPT